jgi:carbamoyltransferase
LKNSTLSAATNGWTIPCNGKMNTLQCVEIPLRCALPRPGSKPVNTLASSASGEPIAVALRTESRKKVSLKILGISGLSNSSGYKSSHGNPEPEELRIRQGLDSAAALLIDGEIVAAAAEERFTGEKQTGSFPVGAIGFCLAERGLRIGQIDEIVHAFDFAPYEKAWRLDNASSDLYDRVFSRDALLNEIQNHFPGYPRNSVHHVSHHMAHAASAYFTSGWDECLAVVVDGMGEVESATAYHASGGKLKKLRSISARDSVGIFYSLITMHLGFDFNGDEYKVMGLAPYGHPEKFRSFFEKAVELRPNGSVRIPILSMNQNSEERENYRASRRVLEAELGPRRKRDDEITDRHCDLAAALQECLERTMFHICSYFQKMTSLRRLAMAGGVALNCTANGSLVRSGLFDEIYVQPAAGDDGTALGAALYRASMYCEGRNNRLPVPFFGPASSETDIAKAFSEYQGAIRVTPFPNLVAVSDEAAKRIAHGQVIAWHRGRMEFGPRALGNRSILADPAHPEMRDRINAMVKKREAFRPFAPAVSFEQAHIWFEMNPGTHLPYMITTVNVRDQHRRTLPAITHVNGSARVQTVSEKDNPDFHVLLKAIGKITGREMLLNTSFNVKGQPIVNTPREAIATFLGTGIQALFLENHLVTRQDDSD